MKRTLEKLDQDRKDKEIALSQKIEEIQKQSEVFKETQNPQKLQHLVSRLEEILTSIKETSSKKRKSPFTLSSKRFSPEDFSQRDSNQQALVVFKELQRQVDFYSTCKNSPQPSLS